MTAVVAGDTVLATNAAHNVYVDRLPDTDAGNSPVFILVNGRSLACSDAAARDLMAALADVFGATVTGGAA